MIVRPPCLETWPGHDAVLNGENPQQKHIDEQRLPKPSSDTAVDGLGDIDVADKTDGVQKREKKDDIRYDAIHECENPGHDDLR